MSSTCDLVLPCRNEATALPWVLSRVPHGFRVIVVDNGSTDDTAHVAEQWHAVVVSEPRAGYGAAVHAGVQASGADVLAVMDADGSLNPAHLDPLVEAVTGLRTDLALGRRRPLSADVWPWHARAGNAFLRRRLRCRTGLRVDDIAPVRVCHRLDLLGLGVRDMRFGYPVELLARAQRAGWRMVEYDVAYGPRVVGTTSKVSGSLPGTLYAAVDLVRALP